MRGMQRAVALAVVAFVALAGCSTQVSGNPMAATHPTATSDGPAPSGGGLSASASEATRTLDGASMSWLAEFCTGFADVASHAGPDTNGMSNDQIVRAIVQAYTTMSASALHAESDLQALAEPTFPGEQRIVPAAIEWFRAVNTVYGQGAKKIAGTRFGSLEQLSTAINTVEAGMDDANATFSAAIGQIDPSVTNAMRGLPQCGRLVNSTG